MAMYNFIIAAATAAILVVTAVAAVSCKGAGTDVGPRSLRIYQVMVSTFVDGDPTIGYGTAWGPEEETGGDLAGVIKSLDYIKSLGCNALWLTPVFDSSGANSDDNAGYDGRLDSTGYYAKDYFKIDPHFGSEETFRKLVEECHSRGIYVILDGVFGHWGDEVAPSPSGRVPERRFGKFHGASFPESLEFFKEVAAHWIREYKIDGWRLDQCYQLGTDGEGVKDGHNYWYEIRKAVEEACAKNRADGERWGTLGYMVGECWRNTAKEIQSSVVDAGTAEGAGLPSCFDFPARNYVNRVMTKTGINAGGYLEYVFRSAEKKGYSHPDGFEPNLFVSNHDLDRLGTAISAAFPEQRPGGRESATYYAKHKVAMAVLAAYTGPITIYYGDEWGAFLDPARIGKFPCAGDNSSRTAGKTDGFTDDERSVMEYTAALMKMRDGHPALSEGANETLREDDGIYIGRKTLGGETVVYLINCSDTEQTYTLDKGGRDLLTGGDVPREGTLAPWSAVFAGI